MKQDINEIEINGVRYLKADSIQNLKMDSNNCVIIRSQNAGVFFGVLYESNLKEAWVKLKNARRIWYWDGAASLSQLAVDGTSKPQNCKFPTPVVEHTILQVLEIIPCTEKAVKSITEVKVWEQ